MSDTITAALERHRAGDQDSALDLLLSRWTEVRNEQLAAAIERLSHDPERAPLSGHTRAEQRREWLAIADDATPRDYARLLTPLPTFTCTQATELLGHALHWRASPVVPRYLLELLSRPPSGFQGPGKESFWALVLALLASHGDPRTLPDLEGLPSRFRAARWAGVGPDELPASVRYLVDELPAVVDKIRSFPTLLPEEEYEACVTLCAPLDDGSNAVTLQRQRTALLEQVYANPEDDEARLVLADALSDLGDAQGEFITLQMARELGDKVTEAMRARERKLLLAHQRTWLGGIEKAVGRGGLIYRRGFPAEGRVESHLVEDLDRVFMRPEWLTFETLDLTADEQPGVRRLITRPDFFALRRLVNGPRWIFEVGQTLPIEELTLPHTPTPADLRAARDVLPHLRLLDCRHNYGTDPHQFRVLWTDGGSTLECLMVHPHDLGEWFAEIVSGRLTLPKLVMSGIGYEATVAGDRVVLELLSRLQFVLNGLARELADADLGFASDVEVRVASGVELATNEVLEIERLLKSAGARMVRWDG